MKNTTIITRLNEADKAEFIENCKRKNLKPSEVLRKLIIDINERERDSNE